MQEIACLPARAARSPSAAIAARQSPPGDFAQGTGASEAALARVIEAEILPRLLMAHASAPEPAPADSVRPEHVDIGDFSRLLLSPDRSMSLQHVAGLRRRGMAAETILLNVLAPAARHLDDLWQSDRLDFVGVTLGLGQLRLIAQVIETEWESSQPAVRRPRRALFLPAPGETHSFGAAMVAAFFRAAGWRVIDAPGPSLAVVQAQWVDILGFSLSCRRFLEDLRPAIAQARSLSKNPALRVLVGGVLFNERPDCAQSVGADATARDAADAVAAAHRLLERGLVA